MEKRDYIKLDPEEKDRILILDSDRKIYLSKAPKELCNYHRITRWCKGKMFSAS
ncbi:MAG UNVERIFIED_CONTAM: hypothetical protein LVQ98_02555 [Rickettsiaceae bacterium]